MDDYSTKPGGTIIRVDPWPSRKKERLVDQQTPRPPKIFRRRNGVVTIIQQTE